MSQPEREAEATAIGLETLVDGVRLLTLADRLAVRAAGPMRPRRNPYARQKACDVGLFDEVGRAQIDLMDLLSSN